MKIVLIGFMGAGKTTVGKNLAQKLSLKFVDMDDLIKMKSGKSSVKEIFDVDGEITFRELEIAVAKDLYQKQNAVISTGGGVVMNKIILDYLRKNSHVIFLKTSFEESKKRTDQNARPLFQNLAEAKELYNFRLPLYQYYANIIIETDNKNIEDVVEEIIKQT